ncbi:MAG TPA: hypothetical protein VGA61_14890, partial [Anaerolineae bacterium]
RDPPAAGGPGLAETFFRGRGVGVAAAVWSTGREAKVSGRLSCGLCESRQRHATNRSKAQDAGPGKRDSGRTGRSASVR